MPYRYFLSALLTLHLLAITAYADSPLTQDQVLTTLRARDAAISSYTMTLKRAFIQSPIDVAKIIRDLPATQPSPNPQDLFAQLLDRLAPAQKLKPMTYQNLQKGRPAQLTKSVMAVDGGFQTAIFRDAKQWLVFTQHPNHIQVDLYSPTNGFPERTFTFDQLGLSFHGALATDKVTSFQADPDGYSLRLDRRTADSKTRSILITLAPDLVLRKLTVIWNDQIQSETWYLCPTQIGPSLIPRIILEVNGSGKDQHIWPILIEDLEINPQFADDQLAVPEIPDGATVVDYRKVNRQADEKPIVTTHKNPQP